MEKKYEVVMNSLGVVSAHMSNKQSLKKIYP